LNTCGDKSIRNITVSSANIEEYPAAVEGAHELYYHPIAVSKPEGEILNLKARGITVRRIGYCLHCLPGEPKAGLALLKSRRQVCEIEMRAYRVLLFLQKIDCSFAL
jgi:hypothetical protein